MSLEELTHEESCYAAMRLLAETAWRRDKTVEALLTLTDLLDPPGNGDTTQRANEAGAPDPP